MLGRGERVGNYEIVRMLARGGMAVVFLVRQPALDREVVLKRLDLESDDPTLAQRFVQEARLAATLDHQNIVTLFDFFEHDGVPYIAMEYVAGGSLRGLIGRLRMPQVFGVVENILAGLGHAERRGIAHRDLKPENVLLTLRGTAKIADFGIARAYDSLTHRLTASGMAIGTPAYMAPEQALNEPIGPYTDLYALGVMVYEMLAGRPPFDSETPVGVLYRHVHEPPAPLKSLLPHPQPDLCEWVEWLLQKAPHDRPQSAAEAWNALEEIAVTELGAYWRRDAAVTASQDAPTAATAADTTEDGATVRLATGPTARKPTPTPPAPRPRRPRRRARMAAAAAALAGVAGAAAYAALSREEDPPGATPARDAPRHATPYDFDGDGRQELVMALLRARPRGGSTGSGVVLVHRGAKRRPSWSVITEAGAGIGGRPRAEDSFGSGLASADFDGDGRADLAIGTPGKGRVSVLYGLKTPGTQFPASRMGLPEGAREYGFALLARDLDDDGYDDLLVGAPGPQPLQRGTGAIQLLFGGPGGLQRDRTRIIRRPPGRLAGFGTRLRTGDIDRDGDVDLVEGAPDSPDSPGHATYCPGTRRGPLRCGEFAGPGGTSSLAVADVNGDRYMDVVQGDDGAPDQVSGELTTAGEVRLWLGGRRGPRSPPMTISQQSPDVPDSDEPGDRFGAVVEAADMDSDGFAEMIVAAVGEDDSAGRVTVVRGGRSGYATTGHSAFGQDSRGVPGRSAPGVEFGSTLTALRLSDDRRLDVAIAVRGEAADDRVMVVLGGAGVFTPDETETQILSGAGKQVRDPRAGRIRFARGAGT